VLALPSASGVSKTVVAYTAEGIVHIAGIMTGTRRTKCSFDPSEFSAAARSAA
jgi:hypothetical protein